MLFRNSPLFGGQSWKCCPLRDKSSSSSSTLLHNESVSIYEYEVCVGVSESLWSLLLLFRPTRMYKSLVVYINDSKILVKEFEITVVHYTLFCMHDVQ